MAKEFLPKNRQWTQPNDGVGSLLGSFNVDFFRDRGKVRVSKPVVRLFDENESFSGGGNTFDGYASSIQFFPKDSSDAYWVVSDKMFYTTQTDSDMLNESNWVSDGQSNTPSYDNEQTDSVVFDNKLLVIDNNGATNGDIAAYNGSSWTASWWKGTLSVSSNDLLKFLVVGANGNLYVLTTTGKVMKVTTAGTKTETGDGTLDFSAKPYEFQCVVGNSNRLFIGFKNTANGRGGVIEWDMSANSSTANRIHELSSYPQCLAVDDDMVIAIMNDGSVKYFNGTRFVDYPNAKLPRIDGIYDKFIHPNGWAIIDNMPHFLIKGTEYLEGRDNQYARDVSAKFTFPSAVYCLDPVVGLYPRFALTNNPSTQTHYSQPTVNDVGALYSLDKSFSKFLASYEVYTDTAGTNLAVLSYHDEQNTNDSKGWLLFNDVERTKASKNIELLHRVMESGNTIRVYFQEFHADEQVADGTWTSTTRFNTTDSVSLDDTWLGWVKTGDGAGQFLRVDSVNTTPTNEIIFKEANTYAANGDFGSIEFIKFRYMGKVDTTTRDYTTLSFPSEAKTRKVKILFEIEQVSGTVNELDYAVIET